jgi:hypothetical protein
MASHEAPATLAELIAAMDEVQHALPVDRELHGAFSRLTAAGYLREVDARFVVTDRVPLDTVQRIRVGSAEERRAVAAAFLRAEAWTSASREDPANDVVYPGLTAERLQRADREYRRRFHAEYRRLRNQGDP